MVLLLVIWAVMYVYCVVFFSILSLVLCGYLVNFLVRRTREKRALVRRRLEHMRPSMA